LVIILVLFNVIFFIVFDQKSSINQDEVELIESQEDVEPDPKLNITKKQAQEIALVKVPGRINYITTETKFGRQAYVIEVDPIRGPEIKVIIDIETGIVLDIEN